VDNLDERLAALEGQVTATEGAHLRTLAAQCAPRNPIVEIGSYCGKSTAYLAAGSMDGGHNHIFAIDLWGLSNIEGGWDLSGSAYQLEAMDTLDRVVSELGFADLVTAVRATSKHAVRVWSRPIALLHIDAEHTYSGLRTDYEGWSPWIIPGGILVMHDYRADFPDLTRYMDEVILTSGLWEGVQVVERMLSMRRRSEVK